MKKHLSDNFDGNDLKISISCPVETKILRIIRVFISALAREIGFNDEDTAKIEIAVDEACSNVICHAYKFNNKRAKKKVTRKVATSKTSRLKKYEISLNVFIKKNCLRIEILDYGEGGKNVIKRGIKEIEEYFLREDKHGLGTYIIKKVMDKVEFDFDEDKGTRVSMIKYLPLIQ